jgi:TonB family protein
MKNSAKKSFSRIGAYELKASYQRNMLASTIITAIIALAAALFFTSNNSEATPVEPHRTRDSIIVIIPIPPTITYRDREPHPVQPRNDISVGIPTPIPDDELPDDFDERGIATKDDLYALIDGQSVATDIGDGDIVIYEPPGGNEYPDQDSLVIVEIYPKMIYEEAPIYPRLAQTASMEGDVWIKALVDIDGSVAKAVVYKSSDSNIGFDSAAIDAALLCRYSPGIQNGIPVPVWVCYKVEFRLKKEL